MTVIESLSATRSMGVSFCRARTLLPQRELRGFVACLCLLAACSAPERGGSSAAFEPFRGQVLSESGAPIENAMVEAIVLGGRRREEARSDASGAFVFNDLSVDRVESLHVEHPDFGAWPPPCVHPEPMNCSSSTPIRLRARKPERIVALDLLTGEPIDRIFVERFSAPCHDESAETARTPLAPRVELDTRTQSLTAVLENEVYRISAEGFASTQVRFEGDALDDDKPTTVRLVQAAEIVGQVVVPTGITSNWSIVLTHERDGTSQSIPLGRDGRVEIHDLERRPCSLSIRNDLGIVVKRFDAFDGESWRCDFGQLEVEDLRNTRFTLRNVDASASAVESLFLRSPRHHFGASFDEQGVAQLSHIPAGEYRVQVLLASGERLELRNLVSVSASNDGVLTVDISDARKR
jgi:hypothetical protein